MTEAEIQAKAEELANKKAITLNLPEERVAELQKEAAEKGITLSQLIDNMLTEAVAGVELTAEDKEIIRRADEIKKQRKGEV